MMNQRNRYVLAVVIVALIIGGWIVLTSPRKVPEGDDDVTVPEESELKGVVNIGVMASHDEVYPVYEFITDMAMRDINEHCANAGLNCSFEFLLSNANGTGANALNLTQMYKNMGIDLVIGYGWSSQLCVTRTYAEANGMVLLSPSSRTPQLAQEDNIFRLCPHDFKQATPTVKMMRSLGVTDAVVIQRLDQWGDGLAESFKKEFEEDGGRVQEVIRYPGEIVGDGFLPYVKMANATIQDLAEKQGQDKAAILLISFSENRQILERASSHPALMGVKWFGIEDTVNSSSIQESSCPEAAAVSLISPIPSITENDIYLRINRAFVNEFNRNLSYYDAYVYDCCWVMALSVLEAGTDDSDVVRTVLPWVASNYSGISGPCTLDANGDRAAVDYDIWGYFEVDGEPRNLRCGFYNATNGKVVWDEALVNLPGG